MYCLMQHTDFHAHEPIATLSLPSQSITRKQIKTKLQCDMWVATTYLPWGACLDNSALDSVSAQATHLAVLCLALSIAIKEAIFTPGMSL